MEVKLITIDAHEPLQFILALLKRWTRERFFDRIETQFPDAPDLPDKTAIATVESISKRIVPLLLRQDICRPVALSPEGSKVRLAPEIFELGLRRSEVPEVSFTKVVIQEDRQIRKELKLSEVVATNEWLDRFLAEIFWKPEEQSNSVYRVKEPRKTQSFLPVSLDRVPVLNWANGTVDLSVRDRVIRLNEACYDIYREAEKLDVLGSGLIASK